MHTINAVIPDESAVSAYAGEKLGSVMVRDLQAGDRLYCRYFNGDGVLTEELWEITDVKIRKIGKHGLRVTVTYIGGAEQSFPGLHAVPIVVR